MDLKILLILSRSVVPCLLRLYMGCLPLHAGSFYICLSRPSPLSTILPQSIPVYHTLCSIQDTTFLALPPQSPPHISHIEFPPLLSHSSPIVLTKNFTKAREPPKSSRTSTSTSSHARRRCLKLKTKAGQCLAVARETTWPMMRGQT